MRHHTSIVAHSPQTVLLHSIIDLSNERVERDAYRRVAAANGKMSIVSGDLCGLATDADGDPQKKEI